ncbi:mitochondrial membrane protein Pet127 [Magnaporthiopsis poae ATCC 64411]|uniref:Mitochondrial membrane protein Pet127 n=1 Tax=Magnaporthiopsis poae (strain ATCC 64411 / 73-15) TaxID=644358 RepID=A0A0C4E942_MAGP6|nr:mitochondrial membrane protein Pet127 [Magnaporthiopsis poae ATCC 64411]
MLVGGIRKKKVPTGSLPPRATYPLDLCVANDLKICVLRQIGADAVTMLSLARSGLRIPAGGLRFHSTRRALFPSAPVRLSPRRLYSSDDPPEAKSPPASETGSVPDAQEGEAAEASRRKKQIPPKSKLAWKSAKTKQSPAAQDAKTDAKADGPGQGPAPAPESRDGADSTSPKSGAPTSSGARTEKRRHKLAQSKARTNAARTDQMNRMWRESLEILKDLRAAHVGLAQPHAMAAAGKTAAEAAKESGQESPEPSVSRKVQAPPPSSTQAKKAAGLYAAKMAATSPQPGHLGPSILSNLPSEKLLKTVKPDDKDRQVELLAGALGVLRKVLLEQPPGAAQYLARTTPERDGLLQHAKGLQGKLSAAPPVDLSGLISNAPEPSASVAPTKTSKKKASLASQFQKAEQSQGAPSFKKAKEGPKPAAREGKKATVAPATIGSLDAADVALAEPSPDPNASRKKGRKSRQIIHSVRPAELELTPIDKPQPPVPNLQYGLDRVLFNPGVYQLQDPRSRVYNFDPFLSTIMPTHEFDFNALKRYVTSSKDNTLTSLAAELGKKYTGSTSSMTSMLSHFHYLISSWRPINAVHTTRGFALESDQFTRIQRGPAAVFLQYKDGTYAIDADKEFDNATILSMLGKSMEKFLTLPREEYELYHRDKSHELSEEARNDPEAFHYTTMGDFLMRSQLDAHDPRLPGTGMYDLKTRSVITIRMQSTEVHKGMGYEIRDRFGQWESFEREYFDMIRSAFLKYSLQVRMGRMDGIFVAFHNTERIFGFQYISLGEMDLAIHGTSDTALGDQEFKLSLHLLNKILDKATARFPKRSLRLHFETRPSEPPFMYVFAKPVTDQEIADVQEKNKEAVEEFERRMMNLEPEGAAAEVAEGPGEEAGPADGELEIIDEDEGGEEDEAAEEKSSEELSPEEQLSPEEVWEDMMNRVDQAMEDDALGIASVREAVEEALTQSGLLRSIPQDQSREYIDALLGAITSPDLEGAAEVIQNGSTNGNEDATGAVEDTPRPSAVDEYATAEPPVEQLEVGESETDSAPADVEEISADEIAETVPDEAAEVSADEVAEAPADEAAAMSEEEVADVAEDGVAEPSGNVAAETPEDDVTETSAESETVVDEDEAGEDDAEAESETSADVPDSAETQAGKPKTGPELLSLKDLIIKLAEHSQSSPVPVSAEPKEKEEEPDRADSRRLKKFEKILSEMLSNSKRAEGEDGAASADAAAPEAAGTGTDAGQAGEDEIMAIAVTIRNSTNRGYVKRLNAVSKNVDWALLYSFEEIEAPRAQKLYQLCKNRREALLTAANTPLGNDRYQKSFAQTLQNFTNKGRAFRVREDKRAREHGKVDVYGLDEPLDYETVFAHVPKTRAWSTAVPEDEDAGLEDGLLEDGGLEDSAEMEPEPGSKAYKKARKLKALEERARKRKEEAKKRTEAQKAKKEAKAKRKSEEANLVKKSEKEVAEMMSEEVAEKESEEGNSEAEEKSEGEDKSGVEDKTS